MRPTRRPPGDGRRRLVHAAVACVLLGSLLAGDRAYTSDLGEAFRGMAMVTEFLIPDLRLEFDDGAGLVLAWPIAVTVLGAEDSDVLWRMEVVAEPQVDLRHRESRFLPLVRQNLSFDPGFEYLLVFLEGGYVWGSRSDAPILGGGMGALTEDGHAAFTLGYRHTFVNDGRFDVSLGMEIYLFGKADF